MVNDAISSWVNVENQCTAYILIVSNGPPPPNTPNLFAATFSPPQAKNAKTAFLLAFAEPAPPPYDPTTDPVAQRWFNPTTNEDKSWKFTSFVSAQQDDALLKAFEAPTVSLSCNRAQLEAAAGQYSQAAAAVK